jgi:hypothetical protein
MGDVSKRRIPMTFSIFSHSETAKTTGPNAAQLDPSTKWTMKWKLKAAHQVLVWLDVSKALTAEADLEKWASLYEVVVGAPPPAHASPPKATPPKA